MITKNMLQKGVILFALALFTIPCYFLRSAEGLPQKQPGPNPGWHEQWFDMRKDANGEIPFGLNSKWWKHDQQNSAQRSGHLLENPEELGPFDVGGRTRALLIDQSNSNRYFAGSVTGGLWMSEDKGASWSQSNDAASCLSVSSITQNPFNSNVIYYGTGEVLRATTFQGEGIFKSTDGGETFSQLPSTNIPSFDVTWSIKHAKNNANTLFVATANGGVRKSSNGGASFGVVHPTINNVHDIETFPNGNVLIAEEGVGIFYSTNNGDDFDPAFNLPNSGFQRIEMAYSESNPNIVYAALAKDNNNLLGIYKSIDGGINWNPTLGSPPSLVYYTDYCFSLGVDPSNSQKLIFGAKKTYYSINGGDSWPYFNSGHEDNHTFAVHSSTPNEFLIGNDGGVYRKTWSGINGVPTDLNNGYHVTQFYGGYYFPSGSNYSGGTQDNGTQRKFGLTHNQVAHSDGGFTAISHQNSNLGYVELQYGKIMRSSNMQVFNPFFTDIYGGIVEPGQYFNHFIAPFEINKEDGEQLYFATKAKIWRTTNAGDNWTSITNDHTKIYAVGVTKKQNPTVYFGGTLGQFFRLDNAQTIATGNEVDLSASVPLNVQSHTISCITPHPINPNIAYVSFSTIANEPRIFKVSNTLSANPTWTSIAGNLPLELPVNWVEVSPSNFDKIYLGTDFGVYSTLNGGTTWQKESAFPNVLVTQLRLRESDEKLFVFTHGRGVWAVPTNTKVYVRPPYQTSFESEPLDQYWKTNVQNYHGQVEITDQHGPHSGSKHLTFDVNTVLSYSLNDARLHLNLEEQHGVGLNFWWKKTGDEPHLKDGVYISDDGGDTFDKIYDFASPLNNTWIEVNLDLEQLCKDANLTMNSIFVVKFQQYDNYPMPTDGIAIDDVSITTKGRHATLPYQTGFELGYLDPYWQIETSLHPFGLISVSSLNEPNSGNSHLTMSSAINGTYVENEAVLRLNLEEETEVNLTFWWKEFGDVAHAQDGVFFSDDGGDSYEKVYNLSVGNSTSYQEVHLDVDQLAQLHGLDLTNTFHIKFQQYDNQNIPLGGLAFDDIRVLGELPYAPLDYFTSFEANALDPFWETHTSISEGEVAIVQKYGPYDGNQHLISHVSPPGNTSTNEAILRINLPENSDLELEFAWKATNDSPDDEDGVYFSDDQGATFEKVMDLTGGGNDVWNIEKLDIDALCAMKNLQLGGPFQIKFQQKGNLDFGNHGIAIDFIHVRFLGGGISEPNDDSPPLPTATAELKVYPNPTADQLNVYSGDLPEVAFPMELQVFDLQGRLQFQEQVFSPGTTPLSLGALPKGYYLVRLKNSQQSWNQRVIKL